MTTTSYNTPSWGRGRSAAGALLLLLVSAVLGVSNCQPLSVPSVPGPNPFIASSPGAIGPPQPAASSPPPVTPSPVVSAPSVAPVPTPEVGPDPCACTQTGLSGGINTTFIGCGQWLVANGSNAFVCFVVDPANCPSTNGSRYKACAASEASTENNIPTVQHWLESLPQLTTFVAYINAANLTSIPGTRITVLAPTNDAFQGALALEPPSTISSSAAQTLVLNHIIPSGGIQASSLVALRSVEAASNASLPVAIDPSSGNVTVGGAPIIIPDVLASNGVVQILGGVVGMQSATSPTGETSPPLGPIATVPSPSPVAPVPAPVVIPVPPVPTPPSPSPSPSPITTPKLVPKPVPRAEPVAEVAPSPSPPAAVAPAPAFQTIPSPSPSPSPSPITVTPTYQTVSSPPTMPLNTVITTLPPPAPAVRPVNPPLAPITAQPSYSSLGGAFAGCDCTTTGVSGGVSTGQVGCMSRLGEQFTTVPFSFCYTDPSCPLAQPSQNYPGAAWRLCP